MHPAGLPEEELITDVEWETYRGPGPGGQHRNKTDSFVRVTHVPTGIRAQAGERRHRTENQRQALIRLRHKLAVQHREPLPEPPGPVTVYEPSDLWKSRLTAGRVVVSVRHRDYPALLAEALDVLAHCEDDAGSAAALLRITTGQMIRFLKKTPAVLADLNERRRRQGLKPYR